MWLLNAKTRKLEYADRQRHKHYAILSHTWGDGEVLYDDIDQQHAKRLNGYQKIDFACRQALDDQLQYVWIDTCCIDKRSSAELSEAINSMYRWYYDAQVCYAYIADVQAKSSIIGDDHEDRPFANLKYLLSQSRWFYRGWTLQELIAPRDVKFYDRAWRPLGTKVSLRSVLSDITKISSGVLKDRDALSSASIAQRMSWAAGRKTTRLEDQAYSLLGMFDVNMPLLYGEGTKAFLRLQEAIIHSHDSEKRDHSILLWSNTTTSLLAPSPADFAGGHRILTCLSPHDDTYELTKAGLRLTLSAKPSVDIAPAESTVGSPTTSAISESELITVVLNCRYYGSSDVRIALRLRKRPRIGILDRHDPMQAGLRDRVVQIYDRLPEVTTITSDQLRSFTTMELTIARKPFVWPKMPRKISISAESAIVNSWWYRDLPFAKRSTNYTNRTGGVFPTDDPQQPSNVDVLHLAVASDCPPGSKQHRVIKISADRTQTPPQLSVDCTDLIGISQPLLRGAGGVEVRSAHARNPSVASSSAGAQHMLSLSDDDAPSVAARLVYRDDHLIWHLHIAWLPREIGPKVDEGESEPAQLSSLQERIEEVTPKVIQSESESAQLSSQQNPLEDDYVQVSARDVKSQRNSASMVPKWALDWRKTYDRVLPSRPSWPLPSRVRTSAALLKQADKGLHGTPRNALTLRRSYQGEQRTPVGEAVVERRLHSDHGDSDDFVKISLAEGDVGTPLG